MTAIFSNVGSSKVEAFKLMDTMTSNEVRKVYEALKVVDEYCGLDMRSEWYMTQLGRKIIGEA